MTSRTPLYSADYSALFALQQAPREVHLRDHIMGFDQDLKNPCLDHISRITTDVTHVWWHVIKDPRIQRNYPNIVFHGCDSSARMWKQQLSKYQVRRPNIHFENFVSSFNGSPQLGRQLLVSALHKRKIFNEKSCSKNFTLQADSLDANILDLSGDRPWLLKLFSFDRDFLMQVVSFGYDQYRFDHGNNASNVAPIIQTSFINLVSEGYSTSYCAFFTEKFLYAVVNQSLFVAWAQPQWHFQLMHVFGFKLYDKIFDYNFDWQQQPLPRLATLLDMVCRYQNFSVLDWHDLYLLEQDSIQFNYQHFISGDFLRCFQRHA